MRNNAQFSLRVRLPDSADEGDRKPLLVDVWLNAVGMLEISAEGYGEYEAAEGYGSPVLLEWRDQRLSLHVSADINSPDKTTISLDGAREAGRNESATNAASQTAGGRI